jgi:hypothetical protein
MFGGGRGAPLPTAPGERRLEINAYHATAAHSADVVDTVGAGLASEWNQPYGSAQLILNTLKTRPGQAIKARVMQNLPN